jgi:Fungal Zn(2)-Cys(6) binuclear cluster domain
MEPNLHSNSLPAMQLVSAGTDTNLTDQAQAWEPAKPPSGPSPQTHARTSSRKTITPSCNLCRRRKVKCDRGDPCSHCVRLGAVCVFTTPSGAPRGRKGGRRKLDSELLNRIARLESLLKQGSSGSSQASPSAADGTLIVWHHVLLPTSVFRASTYCLTNRDWKNQRRGFPECSHSNLFQRRPKRIWIDI